MGISNKELYRVFIIFTCLFIITVFLTYFGINFNFVKASDLIVFLSITIGYQITSMSVLYNSKILKNMYDTRDKDYRNKLIKIAVYYKYSIYFGILFIAMLIFISDNFQMTPFNKYIINKSCIMPSIFFSIAYLLIKSSSMFFKIFILPRNE